MEYEWDEAKQIINRSKHTIGFEVIAHFNWSEAVIIDRSRHQDGEPRFAAIGVLNSKLYAVIFYVASGSITHH